MATTKKNKILQKSNCRWRRQLHAHCKNTERARFYDDKKNIVNRPRSEHQSSDKQEKVLAISDIMLSRATGPRQPWYLKYLVTLSRT